jgi:hypothetical protein
MTEILLKYLSWPVAFIIIVAFVILLFRKTLNKLLQRGGVKIGKDLMSIDVATAAAAVSDQSETAPIENSLSIKPDSEADPRLAQVKRPNVSVIIREQEERIRADLSKLQLADAEAVDLLIQHLASTQLFLAAERLYRIIFGSQISVLKHLNLYSPVNRVIIQKFYDEAKEKFPQVYEPYPFEAYVNFMKSQNLVNTPDDINYSITQLGKDFLQWMVVEGRPEEKPF